MSAIRGEPWSGLGAFVTALPGRLSMWSGAYLHRVALGVDQVAVMAYDSGLLTQAMFGGYRQLASGYPRAVEDGAGGAAGIRLTVESTGRRIGVAMYVDFTATEAEWASYHSDWNVPTVD